MWLRTVTALYSLLVTVKSSSVPFSATTPQFYHGFLSSVLYSRHKIFLFSFFNTFSSTIISFLPHLVYSTLLPLPIFSSLFLDFHASRHLVHHTFVSYFPETNSCPQFSFVLVLLYWHPPHSTIVTISHLVVYSLSSIVVPLGGIPHVLLYSCTFLYIECTSFSFSHLLFSTSMFGHFHLQCLTPQHLKPFTSSASCHLIYLSPPSLLFITLLVSISNLFWDFLLFSFSFPFLQLQARCPNFLQLQHSLSHLPYDCALNEARACFSLSMLLIRFLYCVWDIMLISQGYEINDWSYLMLCLLGHKIFIQPGAYWPTNYCPNSMVRLLPQGEDP